MWLPFAITIILSICIETTGEWSITIILFSSMWAGLFQPFLEHNHEYLWVFNPDNHYWGG